MEIKSNELNELTTGIILQKYTKLLHESARLEAINKFLIDEIANLKSDVIAASNAKTKSAVNTTKQ